MKLDETKQQPEHRQGGAMLDDHGQPLERRYAAKRLNDRAIDELIGLSRGIIADKNVNQQEAEFLRSWMEENISYCSDPIVNQLYCRIQEMLIDGILDKEEQEELHQILAAFTGESTVTHCNQLTTSLPLCSPPPKIEFPTMTFCLTGKFAYGPRRICEEVIVERGGNLANTMSGKVDYLVVGTFCSTDWIHTSYGLKIKKAAELRNQGNDVGIISEDHWAQSAFKM
jgi:NAD-dependent DNA ligase